MPARGTGQKEPQIETCSLQPKDQEKGILSRLLDNSSLLQPNHTGKTDYAYRCHRGLSAEPRFKPQKALYKDALTAAGVEAEKAKKGTRTFTRADQ